eukprot:3018136-Amphidinium_carterae.1
MLPFPLPSRQWPTLKGTKLPGSNRHVVSVQPWSGRSSLTLTMVLPASVPQVQYQLRHKMYFT